MLPLGHGYGMHSLATAIAKVLKQFGCREIYGVGGDYVAGLIRGLDSRIELCPSSNETHAGFSACASAEINGIGCCISTYMVGSIPCLSAAALAVAEKLPVVFISGAPGQAESQGPLALHHALCDHDAETVDYDKAIAAFRALGIRAERLQGHLASGNATAAALQFLNIVEHAVQFHHPVFVEVPRDLALIPVSADLTTEGSIAEPVTAAGSTAVRMSALALKIENRLRTSRHPLVYVGDKIRRNRQLKQALMEFCHKFQIPFASDACAKGVFSDYDPLNIGIYNGIFSSDSVREYIDEKVDCVIEIGLSAVPRDISAAFNTGTHSIIDRKERSIGVSEYADDREDETALLRRLLHSDIAPFAFKLNERPIQPYFADTSPLTLETTLSVLTEVQMSQHRPFIYIPEVGTAFFSSFTLPTRDTQLGPGWISNPWYGAMGTSLPYARAIGRAVKHNQFDEVPLVVTGDGGFHFQTSELVHFQRERLPVIILLLRNNAFAFGKSSNSSIYESCSSDFNAIKLIESYGGHGTVCRDAGSLRRALSQYVASEGGLRLIEIPIEQEQDHKYVSLLNGFIQSKAGLVTR